MGCHMHSIKVVLYPGDGINLELCILCYKWHELFGIFSVRYWPEIIEGGGAAGLVQDWHVKY